MDRHPEAMCRDEPLIWQTVEMFRCGIHDPRWEWETLSAFEHQCLQVLKAASAREEIRKLKAGGT